jgi:hypothetical protein
MKKMLEQLTEVVAVLLADLRVWPSRFTRDVVCADTGCVAVYTYHFRGMLYVVRIVDVV